jgi:hypothetical protein
MGGSNAASRSQTVTGEGGDRQHTQYDSYPRPLSLEWIQFLCLVKSFSKIIGFCPLASCGLLGIRVSDSRCC